MEQEHERRRCARDHQHVPLRGVHMMNCLPLDGVGGLPLQKTAMADVTPVEDPYDCIHGKPSLMRQKRRQHSRADQFVARALSSMNRALQLAGPAVQQRGQRRDRDCQRDHDTPDRGRHRRQPSEQQQKERRNGNQASAKVIENPPAADGA